MIKIAVYGKGGIGKSTMTSNLSAAFAHLGKKVIQIGCDPKADSTFNLLGGDVPTPALNYMREHDAEPGYDELVRKGFGGVLCIETGGPTPGQPDVVLFDVLGDVVCGGFAVPIREGYADEVLIVTSGEKMALYAANNITTAVKNFEDRSYAKVRGILLNRRNVPDEEAKVRAFADEHGLPIVADIPRCDDINFYEDRGMTVIEGDPTLEISQKFIELAKTLLEDKV